MPDRRKASPLYQGPLFLGSAFLLMAVAILQKVLSMFNWTIPFLDVFPRTILDWAVALLMFEIALTLRQLVERLDRRAEQRPPIRPDMN